jgi:hypothetical protein
VKKATAALLIVLSGCGGCGGSSDSEADNHGYGFAFDATSRNGLHLRRTGAQSRDAQDLEARAAVIAIVCLGLSEPLPPPPPFVIAVPDGTLSEPFNGWYYSNPPLILLETNGVFEHEAVHYYLEVTTGSPDPTHTNNIAAWACVGA